MASANVNGGVIRVGRDMHEPDPAIVAPALGERK